MDNQAIAKVIGLVLSSAVIGGIVTSVSSTRLRRKELIANATKSALRRVEMYYRIRRRTDKTEDSVAIRDMFHEIQEENDYYQSLLSVESIWLGHRYGQFIKAVKIRTEPLIQKSWKEKSYGPSGQLKDIEHPKINGFVSQFAKDSRRFFNPIMRVWMRLRFMAKRFVGDDEYGL